VKIEAYPNARIGKNLPAQPQLLLDGVADIASSISGLGPGRFPTIRCSSCPACCTICREGVKLYEELVKQNGLRGYSDYTVIGAFMNPHTRLRAGAESVGRGPQGMKCASTAPSSADREELGMVPS